MLMERAFKKKNNKKKEDRKREKYRKQNILFTLKKISKHDSFVRGNCNKYGANYGRILLLLLSASSSSLFIPRILFIPHQERNGK